MLVKYNIVDIATGRLVGTRTLDYQLAPYVLDGFQAVPVPGDAADISGTFTELAAGAAAEIRGDFNISVWGDFAGTIRLERSFDQGSVWLPVTYVDGTPLQFGSPVSTSWSEPEPGVRYRLNCMTWASGTASWRLSV